MKKILEFFQEESGKFSSTRLLFLLFGLGILSVWIQASLQAGILQPIPESNIMFVCLLGGLKVIKQTVNDFTQK